MRTFVIGDIHGCLMTLERLWQSLPFEPLVDRLWLTGDLVHRGPDSAGVLRWAMAREDELGERFQTVLGNHDLLLLAVAEGLVAERERNRSSQVLRQPDAAVLLAWLAKRPLLHCDPAATLVHAGLLPQWSLTDAAAAARRVESWLGSERRLDFLDVLHDGSTDDQQLRAAAEEAKVLTRIRTCTASGRMSRHSGPPATAPPEHRAWFEHRPRQATPLLFGHWAALGLHHGSSATCLDSGCAWGRYLSALELTSHRVIQEPCSDPIPAPGSD